ncbi:hypothetical protein [Streptomyces sp. NPDC006333]|uniref:hypothetical protein n=1 Tax=Streptomyces sp. NPDC006333 TaxID=3156753 RepID=UPI0033BA080D
MAFPETALGLRGELRVGQVWQSITGDLYTRGPITHTRGRPYRSNAADPASCAATIRNLDGRYTPRNPEGPFFGLIGRGTPFRFGLPGGPSNYLAMPGNTDRATTPDVAALDITGDLDLRWEGEADWYSAGAQVLIGKWGAPGNRAYHLRVQAGQLILHTTQDGTTGQNATLNLPAQLPRRAALRATVDVDNGAGGRTWRMYWAPSIAGPWTQVGADIVSTGTITIFASTAPLTIAPEQLDLVTVPRRPVTGKTYRAEVRSGINGTVVAAPDFTARPLGIGGTFTDSAGRVWTLAADAEITDRVIRFEGEVPEWPTEWTPNATDAWTPIQAAGILRRLGQGQRALDSTLRRRIPSFAPLAYWPMEEGSTATQAYSPINGVGPLKLTAARWAQANTLASSSPLPTIAPTSSDVCTMLGRVPSPATAPTSWSVRWVYRLDTPNATQRTFLRILSTGTIAEWYVQSGTTGSIILGKDADGKTIFTQGIGTGSDLFGAWIHVRFTATQSGGNVNWRIDWTDVGGDAGGFGASFAGTVGRPTAVGSPPDGYSADLSGMAIGHISAWASDTTAAYSGAIDAWAGETAAARMMRLCDEEGVPLSVTGSIADTAPVGAQTPAPLLDLLRECAEADGGIFGESQDRRELWYRSRADLYNQAPKLTLDYAAGQLADPFKPVEDDTVRNAWEVQREGGSTGTATLDEGRLSVLDPPDGIGLLPDSVTLNLATDDQTEPMANWLLHLSTWDENRYPSVTVLLHKCPELIPYVMALQVGDKIRIINLPKRFTGSGVAELLVDGWTETLLPRTWAITFTCAPAGPWNVAATAIVEDFEDTTYAVTLTNGGTLPWARSNTRFNTGSWSLRSGAITNNQTSDVVVAVPDGSTDLTFAYRVSSEDAGPGFEGDRLLVLVDGVQVLRAQGETGWKQATIPVTRAGAVTFRYLKDNSTASGEDGAWIDDLTFNRVGPMRVDTDGSALTANVTATAAALTVTATDGPVWITTEGFPAEFPFDIYASGEVMTVAGITDAARDTFGRTTTSGWGKADSGQTWALTGTAADFSVGSGYGAVNQPTTNVAHLTLAPAPGADVDLYADVATSVLAAGGNLITGPLIRAVDNNNWYMARVEFTTTAGIQLSIRKRLAGTETTLSSIYTSATGHTAGTFYRVRLQAFGTALKAKIWPASAVEPSDWHVEVTDTSLSAAANVGTRSLTAAGSTPTSPQMRFDNFRIANPQTFNVSRSRNGVTKPQTAGTPVRLAYPSVIAL